MASLSSPASVSVLVPTMTELRAWILSNDAPDASMFPTVILPETSYESIVTFVVGAIVPFG